MNFRLTTTLMALAAVLCLAGGCKNAKKGTLLPNVSGKAGEVLVVIEREQWEGNLGVAIRDALSGDTPYLAQREPLFLLSNVPPGSFTSLFKVHRNLLMVNINPQNQTTGVLYKTNVWAHPQAVIQLSAWDEDQALEIFKENSAVIAEYIEQSERDRIIANAKLYEEHALQEPVRSLTGGILHFPSATAFE